MSFLREMAGDGAASVGFCRTLPYAGTSVASRLGTEGRLLDGFQADYRFTDSRIDAFYDWVYRTFNHRNHHPDGTRNLLGMALFEVGVRLPGHPWDPAHKTRLTALTALTANANHALIDVVEAAGDNFPRHTEPLPPEDPHLVWLAAHHRAQDVRIRKDLAWLCRLRAEQNALSVTAI